MGSFAQKTVHDYIIQKFQIKANTFIRFFSLKIMTFNPNKTISETNLKQDKLAEKTEIPAFYDDIPA